MARALVVGLAFGTLSAALLSVFTHRALPRVREIGPLERFGWICYVWVVMWGSFFVLAFLARRHWLQLPADTGLIVLGCSWVAPVAPILIQGIRRIPPVPIRYVEPDIERKVVGGLVWIHLLLIAVFAAGAVWFWWTAR